MEVRRQQVISKCSGCITFCLLTNPLSHIVYPCVFTACVFSFVLFMYFPSQCWCL